MPSSGNVVTVQAERSVVVTCGRHASETLYVERQGVVDGCARLFVAPCQSCRAEAEQNGYRRGYSEATPPRTACPTVVLESEPPPKEKDDG